MRVLKSDLEWLCEQINIKTGHATQPYIAGKPQPGCYHLYWAYGGVALYQMCETGTGTVRISNDGCGTKKQLYAFMRAFLQGYGAAQ